MLIFRVHAVKRMVERRIHEDDVKMALTEGEVIEDYPDAIPYPARLMLAWIGERPLHVVSAQDPTGSDTFIITVYEPDEREWEAGFRKRRLQ
ncbi:MAG: DUF4258 domain-containing protein [Chloroflexi bacterium]|nr:DUF4258 domain-containing protein [Chloroflexota bacterium]